jgi:hypothetical protein
MSRNRSRSAWKSVVAVLCAACFLTFAQGAVTQALAAEEWETWPKKPAEPGVSEPQPSGAAKAGDAAGKKTDAGLSAGTIGWIAVGVAAAIGIGVAVGGGGGGGGTTSSHTSP